MTDGRAEKERGARRQGAAYQGALEAVFAILIAGGIGYWADGRFGTSPWLLLLGFGIGFGSFVLRLFRLGRQLREDEPPAGGMSGEGLIPELILVAVFHREGFGQRDIELSPQCDGPRMADFLVHVLDVTNQNVEHHHATTLSVLGELGAADRTIVTVFNKVDRISKL